MRVFYKMATIAMLKHIALRSLHSACTIRAAVMRPPKMSRVAAEIVAACGIDTETSFGRNELVILTAFADTVGTDIQIRQRLGAFHIRGIAISTEHDILGTRIRGRGQIWTIGAL